MWPRLRLSGRGPLGMRPTKKGSLMSSFRWLAVLAFASILALGVAACGSSSDETDSSSGSGSISGEVAGAGATSQEAAQEAWTANFENENSGATISYDPVGSGGGREQFIAGGVGFAGSDAAISEEEGEAKAAVKRCSPGELIEVPAYVSPIAIIYNLPGVESLQLLPGNPGEDLQPGNHQLERQGDRRRQPRRRTARHPHRPGQPLRRVRHDGELHRISVGGRPQHLDP